MYRFRLRESEMSTIMYLIEGDPKKNQRLPPQNLESALVRLLVSDGFLVQRTPSVDVTVQFLIGMTNTIREMLDRDGLDSHLYKYEDLHNFNSVCSKNKKVLSAEEILGRQLCCMHGVSAQIAETIIETYKTPRQLCDAFEEEGQDLLGDVVVKSKFLGVAARKIGPACSRNLSQMYTLKKYQ
jgi:ERCC4-type nuclease